MSEGKRTCALEADFSRLIITDSDETFGFGNFTKMGEYQPQTEDSFMNYICEWPEKESEMVVRPDFQPRISLTPKLPFSGAKVLETPLAEATRSKNLSLMAKCLSDDPNIIDHQNRMGFTALHYAAKGDFMEGVNLLIENHCTLDLQNFIGWTPLMIAIYNQNFDIANRLMDAGASPYILSPEFESAITLAASQSEYVLLHRTINAPSDCKELRDQVLSFALIHAALAENIALAISILESKADLHFCLPNQMPPLNIAAGNGCDILVGKLIIAGAPLDSRDKLDFTPLMQAASGGHLSTCQILCSSGADVEAVHNGLTAKDMASELGHAEAANYLQNMSK